MPVCPEECGGDNPFAAARARTAVRAGFGAAMVVAVVGFAAFYRGGGGLLFGVLVVLLPTFLPFVRRRATSAGFAGLATLVIAPLVAVPIVLAADAAFARLVGL